MADDGVLIDVADLIIDQYSALNQSDPALCYRYRSAGVSRGAEAMPSPLIKRELALEQRIIETAARRAPLDERQTKALWRVVGVALTASFTPEQIATVRASHVSPGQSSDYCAVTSRMWGDRRAAAFRMPGFCCAACSRARTAGTIAPALLP